MSQERPRFPNCIMTPGVIRGVLERQRAWDREHPKEREDNENEDDEDEEEF